jgi:ABC-type transport system involved in multi-copper enzyme maturation permease subunit
MKSVGRPPLIGPLFLWELRRAGRRGGFLVFRAALPLVMAAVLWGMFRVWFPWAESGPVREEPQRLAQFAEEFFLAFLALQLGAVCLLTPYYAADAIAEEKERRRLDFLLVTDLTSREIILGKLLARLAYIGMMVAAGLPVLALTQLFGGVDINLLLLGYGWTVLTVLCSGTVATVFAVSSRRGRWAIAQAYVGTAILIVPLGWASFLVCMNFSSLSRLGTIQGVATIAGAHLLVTTLGLAAAIEGLRAIPGRERKPPDTDPIRPPPPPRPRLPVHRPPGWHLGLNDDPLYWRDTTASGTAAPFAHVIGPDRPVLVRLMGGSYVLLAGMIGAGPAAAFGPGMAGGAVLLIPLLLVVGLRASAGITRERERGTLDLLLTIPVPNREILWAKWRASFSGMWWAGLGCMSLGVWCCCAGTFSRSGFGIAAVVSGLIHSGALGAFAASLGLYLTVTEATTLRATLFWMLGMSCALLEVAVLYAGWGRTIGGLLVWVHIVGYVLAAWWFWELACRRFAEGRRE